MPAVERSSVHCRQAISFGQACAPGPDPLAMFYVKNIKSQSDEQVKLLAWYLGATLPNFAELCTYINPARFGLFLQKM